MPQKEDLGDFTQKLASVPRPNLTANYSCSLPSTPYQEARKISFGARSPSPEKLTRDTSPRSNNSETETGARSRGKAPSMAGCKYETGMAFSRRRIPYSIGGDQLERAKSLPKKFLNPVEEEKLSGDMRTLYDRILPSTESDRRRADFVQKLDRILNEQWPGNNIKVHVFGSSGNKLCTNDSDVDICITTSFKALERVCLLANALAERTGPNGNLLYQLADRYTDGMERVVCVPHAKVPIVKFWDPELKLACDMNVNNTLALENTRMIKTYVEIDERVRPLAMIIKQWTKRRIMNDAALGGTLSSYTWICLILNFLQTRNPPILPSLHKKPHQRSPGPGGQIATWNDDIEYLRGFGHANNESLGELLFNFFRYYAYDMEYEKKVVSVREGKLISKEGKKWHLMQNNRLCVEEPFNTERNLGNTADDTSFRGIHLELRRAFDLVKEAKFDECLEEYVFPATEEKIWEKPPPKPPPVLTRSRSQSQSSRGNRGGYNSRGGRHGQYGNRGHGGHSNRRASSAAAMNKLAAPQLGLHNIMGRDYQPRDQSLQAQFDQLRLHDALYNEYQLLQAQEHDLRLLQAQAQMHVQMQAQRSSEPSSIPQRPSRDQPQRVPMSNHMPLTSPIRSGQYFHPFTYSQVPGTPQQNVHTQPSSPSLKHAQPDLRRGMHRSSAADSSSSSNHRSHSQPARQSVPLTMTTQNAPPLPLNNHAFLQYQHLRQQQLFNALEIAQGRYRATEMPMYQDPRRMSVDQQYEGSMPKEYMGYWVNDSPPPRHYMEDPNQRLPTYHDLHARVRGVPQTFSRLRNASRSPSPSPAMPFRNRSFSVRSASSAPPLPVQSRFDRIQPAIPGPRTSGPVIVDGADGWGMPDYSMLEGSFYTTTRSEATSGSDDRLYDTPVTADDTPAGPVFDDGFTPNGHQQYFYAQPTPDPGHVPHNHRDGIYDSTILHANIQATEHLSSSITAQRPERVGKSAGGLGIQFGDHEISHPSVRTNGVPFTDDVYNTFPNTKVETKPEAINGRSDNQPVPNPLLSPVREVRTPSPIARRRDNAVAEAQRSNGRLGKLNLYIPSFAELARAKQEKPKATLAQKPNEIPSFNLAQGTKAPETPLNPKKKGLPEETSKSSKAHIPQTQINGWQQQVNGWQQQSGKKGKKNKSTPSSGQVFPGELLPANEAEQKGG